MQLHRTLTISKVCLYVAQGLQEISKSRKIVSGLHPHKQRLQLLASHRKFSYCSGRYGNKILRLLRELHSGAIYLLANARDAFVRQAVTDITHGLGNARSSRHAFSSLAVADAIRSTRCSLRSTTTFMQAQPWP